MVAQQALFLLNNPFVLERARQIAERVLAREDSDLGKIDWLHLLLLGRPASSPEAELLIAFLSRLRATESEVDAWQHLAHTLICSNKPLGKPVWAAALSKFRLTLSRKDTWATGCFLLIV